MSVLAWTETRPAGDFSWNWYYPSCSSDGVYRLAPINGNRLYLSSNSGSSWSETRPAGDVSLNWYRTAVSGNGQYMLAGVDNGRLYLSINYGANWSEIQPDGNVNRYWRTTAISSTGQYMLVAQARSGVVTGKVWVSTNYGANWTDVTPGGNMYYYDGDISSDGSKCIVSSGSSSGRVYKSSNYGALGSWSETQPAGAVTKYWWLSKISGDGNVLMAGNAERVFISTNFGSNWTETRPEGDVDMKWAVGDLNYDGSMIFLANEPATLGRLWSSENSGSSWVDAQPAGDVDSQYGGVCVDNTNNALVGIYGGRLYNGMFPLPGKPINPDPSDTEVGVDFSDYTVSWETGGLTDTYDIYVGEAPGSLVLASSAQAGTSLEIPEAYRLDRTVDTWYWRVDATNVYGTTTGDVWSFSPYWAPEITSQSASHGVILNSYVTLSVTANGIPAPTYQWKLNGAIIDGATSSSYSFYATTLGSHTYTCVVTNSEGSDTTDPIIITVVEAAFTYNLFNMQLDIDRS